MEGCPCLIYAIPSSTLMLDGSWESKGGPVFFCDPRTLQESKDLSCESVRLSVRLSGRDQTASLVNELVPQKSSSRLERGYDYKAFQAC